MHLYRHQHLRDMKFIIYFYAYKLANGPFLQLRQKIKMVAIVWGLCMEGLWRGWHFAMIGMKKLQDILE